MLAFALREMHITEEQFWEMTPRKFYWLMEATSKVAADMNPLVDTGGPKKQQTQVATKVQHTTVDRIPGWE